MANRITLKMLEARVQYLNKITNSPIASYTRTKDGIRANPGNYHLGQQYAGVSLDQMASGGGVHTIFHTTTRRDLFNQINAFIRGINSDERKAS
jgi:hypothetical protein